jgi:hypothetical protein
MVTMKSSAPHLYLARWTAPICALWLAPIANSAPCRAHKARENSRGARSTLREMAVPAPAFSPELMGRKHGH